MATLTMKKKRVPRQMALEFRERGGKRKGAGRPPGPRPIVLHRARPLHKGRHPVHVTLRAGKRMPNLRSDLVTKLFCGVLQAQKRRHYEPQFQVVHFSIQKDHLHLIVEASEGALRKGVSGLMISFARRLNRLLRRRGKVWGDRYHRHDLATPREVHHALNYVFNNVKKHGARVFGRGFADPYSTADRFEGWSEPVIQYVDTEPWPRTAARTWLLAHGWKKIGLLDPNATPGRRS